MPPLAFGYGAATIDTSVKFVTGLDDLPNGLDTSRWQWADLDGEGLSGLLSEQGGQWFYKRNNGEGAMGAARVIRTRPSLAALNDPQCRLMDLDGDGRLEIVSLRPGVSGSYARDADGEWQGFKPFRNACPTAIPMLRAPRESDPPSSARGSSERRSGRRGPPPPANPARLAST